MPAAPRSIAARLLRFVPGRLARRFARAQDGATAVEFSLVAVPFIALTFAILETALVFFAGQTLEAAVTEASRQIMTGQAQTAGYSKDTFKTNVVCTYLKTGVNLFDCENGVYVDVKNYSTFGSIDNTKPVTNGQFDSSKLGYNPGGPGCIEVVTFYYQWPVYVSLFGSGLSNLNGSKRLLVATAVFRNEPYGPSAC
ncbi:MAG: TadE/TadG family type IV pilus assembly protein [Pseudolabrys sp.]